MSDGAGPGIAIVGFAGRFPGAASAARFWRNITDGVESITHFADDALAAAGHDVAALRADSGFVAARGIIDRPEWFDHTLFGVTASEAELTDPQQRVLLEVAWEALEHAGYDPLRCPGHVGVFAGVGANTYYLNVLQRRPDLLAAAGPMLELIGRDKDFVATRIAYKLNLKGPALSINTACSTSLVTVCQAVQSLLTFQCDMALAGGASIVLPQETGYLFEDGGIQSPDGRTRAFDRQAQGTVFSSGAGLVVLKRLEDALADRDRIHAVIRGAALNNDGAEKASFTAPSAKAHAEVIALAHGLAGVNARSISYVETHGTATPIGDPIEIAGLTEAFRHGTADTGFCAIGSVKTNVGHLDIAAGVAGLIKTTMALAERLLPPSLHFDSPNPAIAFAETPFYVQTRLEPWPGPPPRRAGVSSFGVGGTNAHVVVEEPPATATSAAAAPATLLVVSARTPDTLDATARQLADALAEDGPALPDVAHTLRVGRHAFAHRRAIVARSRDEAVAGLRSVPGSRVADGRAASRPRVVMMFPGGGAQYAGMGRGLLPHAPVYRTELERAVTLLRDRIDLERLLLDGVSSEDEARQLERPATGLPALCAVEHAVARQWMAWGIEPATLIGHSMGEYTAACLAGVMSLAEVLGLVHLRGRLFESLAPGGMLGVPLGEDDVRRRLFPGLAIAAVNAETSCVVAGPPAALDRFAQALLDDGIEARRVRIAVAAHSPMVEPVQREFGAFVAQLRLSPPTLPVVSNVTGTWLTAEQATSPDYWVQHLRQTVRFADGLSTALAEPGSLLIEAGPSQTLSTFALQHPRAEGVAVVPSMRHPVDTVEDLVFALGAVGRAWVAGASVNWTALPDTDGASRVPLPGMQFDRQRFSPASLPGTPAAVVSPAPPVAMTPSPTPLPVATAAPAAPAVPRADRIAAQILEILQKLSGRAAAELSREASFLEMGFDSLFLTQASLRVRNTFKVKVTFRQLFEDAPTVNALAAFIDGKLPPDPIPAPVPVSAALPATASGATAASAALGAFSFPVEIAAPLPANASVLERVVHEQLRVMSEQLRLLSGAAAVLPAPAAMAASPAPVAADLPAPPAAEAATPHFGPFHGIDKSTEALTPHQQRHLDAFIARYVERTKASKALTASQRSRLADPRAVTGFRKIWKETVYQIATDKSSGARVWDIDGNEYIDLTSSFGVTLFGFGALEIDRAVHAQVDRGIELGTLSPLAKEAADLLCELTGMERATFANTGSEAIAGAIRAVRTATGRDWIVVFDDEYHGIAEEVLVKAVGPRGRQRSAPAAPGIPDHFVDKVIVLHYDDPRSLEILRERADEIAGVIIEPVQNRHPDFRPIEALRAVRAVTAECDIPLIFDEMITGFRLHPRGAQGYFGVEADVACYGKIMSGGLPIAAVAGKARYLDAFDGGPWQFGDDSFPESGVTFFGGTFTRNSLSLAAAVAALRRLKATPPATWSELNATADRFAGEVNALFARYRAPMHLEHCGSMFHIAYTNDAPLPRLFCSYLRVKGVHVWDRPFFLTLAHTEAELRVVVHAVDESLAEMQAAHFLGDTPPDDGGRQAPAGDVVPFTMPQMELWLGSQTSLVASSAFNEVAGLQLRGRLSLRALEAAVADVTARHESLRMTVSANPPGFRPGARPLQVSVHDVREEADPAAARAAVIRAFNAEPMDFERGPLWRLGVIHDADGDVLVIAVHHLMCDGWSFGVLLNELSVCYSARVAGTAPGLPLALQLSEYGRDLAARRQDDDARATKAYWLAQYRTLPEPLTLPTDRPRPPVLQYAGGRLGLLIDADLTARVRQFASAHRVTLFSTLQAAFNVLIHRVSGQRDFVVGIPMAGQAFIDDVPLVAHCVNFIAMRCGVDPERTFGAYVAELTRQAVEVNEHQEFTYLELLRALKLPRAVDRDPLVTVSFTIDPAFSAPAFGGLPAEVLTVPRTTARRDLHVNILDTAAGLAVDVDYDASIFDEATVRAWMDGFRACLAAAIADPSQPVWRLPLLEADERRRLAAPAVAPASLRFDPAVTLIGHFEAQVARTPDAVAQSCGGRTLTYRELNACANRVARALTDSGASRGSLVGVCLQRGEHLLPALLGVLKAGAAYVPIDLASPADRVAFMLTDAEAPVLLTERALAGRVPATSAAQVLVEDALDAAGADADPPAAAGPDDLAYVIYTSGTTGQPKGSMVAHRQVVSLMAGSAPLFEFSSDDVWTLFHSHAFDFSVWEMWGALLYGGRVVIVPLDVSRSPEAFCDLLAAERVTVLNQTPSAFRALMAVDLARTGSPALALRYVIFGGEALDLAAIAPWFERHGDDRPALVNMYGITETTVHVTYRRLRRSDTAGGSVIGTPVPLWQVHLLDERQQPVPIGARGEIYVGGAGVTGGYLRRPELTAQRFLENPLGEGRVYRSGDLARRLADGGLEYLGRIDQQVKIRGFRVELGEIDAALGRHPSIAECRVVARDGGPGGLRLVAYLIAAGPIPHPAALQAHLRATLPEYMVPAAYVPVERFPLTVNGKLDVRALPEPDQARLVSAGEAPETASAVERQLARLWSALLGVPVVGRTDDFFDLGGHSLLALTLGQRIEETFGVRLSPVSLFEYSRLDALAACIERQMPRPAPVLAMARPARATPSTGVLARMHPGGTGAPFVWVHGIGGEIYSYMSVTRYLGPHRPVYGFAADWTTAFAERDRTLERIAAAYVDELTSALPDGPYHLGGYCSGAVLVLEMARQLEAAGRPVGALVVVDYDTDTDAAAEPSGPERVMAFMRNLPWWLRDDAIASGAAELAGRVRSKLRRLTRGNGGAAATGATGDIRDALGLWRFPASKLEMLQLHLQVIDGHRCQPIDSPVTVLRPRAAPLLGPWRTDDTAAWQAVARRGVEIHVVPGSHSTILNERFAPALAERIEDAIGKAEAQGTSPTSADPLVATVAAR